MSVEIMKHDGPVNFSKDQVSLIKETICKGGTDTELDLFLMQCKRTGLDPFSRQIYAVKRYNSQERRETMAIQVSIDGFRLIADRTGKYAGQVGPFWCGKDGKWVDIWLSDQPPVACKVGVLRSDFKEPLWATAKFVTFAQTKQNGELNQFWARMPEHMIAKVAESQALRKAFPNDLSGLYTADEMPAEEPQRVSHIDHELPALEQAAPPPPPQPKAKEMAIDEVFEGAPHQKQALMRVLLLNHVSRDAMPEIATLFKEKLITRGEFDAAVNEYLDEHPWAAGPKPSGGPDFKVQTPPILGTPKDEEPIEIPFG